MSKIKNNKIKYFFLGLLLDGIGMLSMLAGPLGTFLDVIWAPISAWMMTRMYKGKPGQVAGVVTFVEELVPGLDIIPTFTIMWFYTYVFKKSTLEKTIEV